MAASPMPLMVTALDAILVDGEVMLQIRNTKGCLCSITS
jgi:hypothetical protein